MAPQLLAQHMAFLVLIITEPNGLQCRQEKARTESYMEAYEQQIRQRFFSSSLQNDMVVNAAPKYSIAP